MTYIFKNCYLSFKNSIALHKQTLLENCNLNICDIQLIDKTLIFKQDNNFGPIGEILENTVTRSNP